MTIRLALAIISKSSFHLLEQGTSAQSNKPEKLTNYCRKEYWEKQTLLVLSSVTGSLHKIFKLAGLSDSGRKKNIRNGKLRSKLPMCLRYKNQQTHIPGPPHHPDPKPAYLTLEHLVLSHAVKKIQTG
jgi:hypothetical protein